MRTTARLGALLAVVAALAVALTGCSSPRDEGGPDPAMRGQWELISATDNAGPIALSNQLISLTIAGDNTTTGRSTCSDYTARVYGTQENLWITTSWPRAQHCGIQAQQDIEQRYSADLNQVRSATVSGGVLDLLAPGIDLRYQKALSVPLDLVVDRTWDLASVSPDSYYATANPTPVRQKGATMYLTLNGELGGTTGCRRFTSEYTENAGEIVISKFSYKVHGRCTQNEEAADTYLISVIKAGFTFISGVGQLSVSSPRAGISLGFTD